MPLLHTTHITKTNTTPFFPLFFSATFSSPFVFKILANPEKMKNNKDRERGGRHSLTENWIRAKQTKGRYCIREDFSIF